MPRTMPFVDDKTIRNAYEQPIWRAAAGKSFRPGGPALTELALAHCNLHAGARVLDAGCGMGATLDYLAGEYPLKAMGADISHKLLSQAHQENSQLALTQSDVMQLPYANETFDAIFSECTLSIFSNRDNALREITRVLKHDGYLILTDVYARKEPLQNMLTQEKIVAQVASHHLRVELWQDHSAALQKFAAQMIWASGSFEHFFQNTALAHVDGLSLADARKNLGYYMLIARRVGRIDRSPSRIKGDA